MLYHLLLEDQIFVVKIVSPLYSFKCFEVSGDVVTEPFQSILAPKIVHGGTVSLPTALFYIDNWHNAKESHAIKDAIRSLAKYED